MTGVADVPELTRRVDERLRMGVHPSVTAFARKLAENSDAQAALFYGSNLRTGELEGVLDFYLLLPGPQSDRIWPRVSYHEWEHDGMVLRAKVATMALDTFFSAAKGELRDTTIWARFVQPSALVWYSDEKVRGQVADAIGAAAETAARLAAALLPCGGTEDDFWRAVFQATYKAEFRVEKPGREDSILLLNKDHFDGLLPAALVSQGIGFTLERDQLTVAMSDGRRREILRWWSTRQRLGKPLNLVRLVKASTTFEGAARYAAWKVERHTGVPVEVTPWRERHPILAAPGVLFKIWRSRRKA